jgi:hypothetical protein
MTDEDKLYKAPCEPCRGTGGLELNGGQSMSNEYIECEICEGSGVFLMDRTDYLILFPDECDCFACDGVEMGIEGDWCFLEGCDVTEDGIREHHGNIRPIRKTELVIAFKEAVAENPKVLEEE